LVAFDAHFLVPAFALKDEYRDSIHYLIIDGVQLIHETELPVISIFGYKALTLVR